MLPDENNRRTSCLRMRREKNSKKWPRNYSFLFFNAGDPDNGLIDSNRDFPGISRPGGGTEREVEIYAVWFILEFCRRFSLSPWKNLRGYLSGKPFLENAVGKWISSKLLEMNPFPLLRHFDLRMWFEWKQFACFYTGWRNFSLNKYHICSSGIM